LRTRARQWPLRPVLGSLGLLLGVLCAAPVAAQDTPRDVPPDHWAYEAVRELAEKGLVTGYPDGSFLGQRTLTRYEMATIIQRLLRHIQEMQPATPPPATPATPAPATPPAQPAAPSVTSEQLAAVRRLVDEFRVELTVIGTDLKAVKERLDALEQKQSSLEEQVTSPEGAIQTTISQVAQLRRLLFSGYVQARYESFENSEEGTGTVDRFTVRRVRLVATARPSNNIGARVQADFVSSAGNPPGSVAASTTVALRDAWIDWYPAGDPAAGPTFTIGQMKWPFGFEVTQSSSVRETPERARWSTTLFPGERDRGAKVVWITGRPWFFEVGGYNGTGLNTNDNNNEKDVVARIRRSFGQTLDVGVSGYWGMTFIPGVAATPTAPAVPAREFVKNRYGADFQLYLPNWKFQAEYVQARDLGRDPWGWDAQIVRSLGSKTQLVAKYDEYDEDNDAPNRPGKQSAWNLGLIRYLDPSTRLKLFYQINREERNDVDNNLTTIEFITLF
jgi:hypothetical protein